MNDCIFCWIGICECPKMCSKFLSGDSKEGLKILEQFNKDIEWVINPVREKYKEKYLK